MGIKKTYLSVIQKGDIFKVVSLQGQHPNIKTEIIKEDLSWDEADDLAEKLNAEEKTKTF